MTRATRSPRFGLEAAKNITPFSVADDFTRTNSTSALGSDWLSSAAWTQHNGTWGISSNEAYVSSGASDNIASIAVASGNSGRVHARVKATGEAVGVLCRVTDANNWILFGLASPASNKLGLYKRVAGAYTALATDLAFTIGTSTYYTLDLVYDGSSLKGYVDGQLKMSATDSAHLGVARAGMRMFGANQGRIDYFRG